MPQRYEWRGGRSFKVPADAVGTAVERIAKRDGVCHPSSLVEEARPETSALHPLFEWNDRVAAEAHRVSQARHALTSLRIVVIEGKNEPPAFLSVTVTRQEEDCEGYAPIRSIRDDAELRHQVIDKEWTQIKGWLDRTSWIPEFQPLRDAMAAVEVAINQPTSIAAD